MRCTPRSGQVLIDKVVDGDLEPYVKALDRAGVRAGVARRAEGDSARQGRVGWCHGTGAGRRCACAGRARGRRRSSRTRDRHAGRPAIPRYSRRGTASRCSTGSSSRWRRGRAPRPTWRGRRRHARAGPRTCSDSSRGNQPSGRRRDQPRARGTQLPTRAGLPRCAHARVGAALPTLRHRAAKGARHGPRPAGVRRSGDSQDPSLVGETD